MAAAAAAAADSGCGKSFSLTSAICDSTQASSKWLDAHDDPLANLHTFSPCVTLADVHGDGDHKLVVGSLGSAGQDTKLKVYQGMDLLIEKDLPDLPASVVALLVDDHEPHIPAVAVACGPCIYVYKNMRPYFKFTLPPVEASAAEKAAWGQAKKNKIDPLELKKQLQKIREKSTVPSLVKSLEFLSLDCPEADSCLKQYTEERPLKKQRLITCMVALKKAVDVVSYLVTGTECSEILVLEPRAFTIQAKMALPSVPAFLAAQGHFDVEYRLAVAGRNGYIYLFCRDSEQPKYCIEVGCNSIGLVQVQESIVVACCDKTLQGCLQQQGRKRWTVLLPADPMTVGLLDQKSLGFQAVLVALANMEVHMYKDRNLVNVICTQDVVSSICFGRYGREESTLIMTTKNGGLIIKILKRTATFGGSNTSVEAPVAQSARLKLPKRTKLYVDQTLREREDALNMHQVFQRDLKRIRLLTARSYVQALKGVQMPVSESQQEPLNMNAVVQGIGPNFKLIFHLQNTSATSALMGLLLLILYDEGLYSVEPSFVKAPLLVPGLDYPLVTSVKCLSDKAVSDVIKAFVLREGESEPLLTVHISMPVSEGL